MIDKLSLPGMLNLFADPGPDLGRRSVWRSPCLNAARRHQTKGAIARVWRVSPTPAGRALMKRWNKLRRSLWNRCFWKAFMQSHRIPHGCHRRPLAELYDGCASRIEQKGRRIKAPRDGPPAPNGKWRSDRGQLGHHGLKSAPTRSPRCSSTAVVAGSRRCAGAKTISSKLAMLNGSITGSISGLIARGIDRPVRHSVETHHE